MSDVESILRRAAADLNALGAAWALIGAIAVGARSEPRFTRDADLAVAVARDAEAEALVARLRAAGYEVVSVIEQEAAGRLAAVRLLPPGEEPGGPVLDLLFSSSGIEPELVQDAGAVEVTPGLELPVAATGHLVALKLLARGPERPQDEIDLRALLAEIDETEIERARAAIRLIHERGHNRGRDLAADLEGALATRPR